MLLPIILGVPWVLTSQLIADTIFIGLVSYERNSDSDREWLGRAAGWLAAIAIAWVVVAFLVFAGGYAVHLAIISGHKIIVAWSGVAGIISGIATALLGSSSKTPANTSGAKPNDYMALACNIGLAVAGPIFGAILIVTLSVALDKVLFDDSLIDLLQSNPLAQQTSASPPQGATLSLKDASLSLQGGTLSLQGDTLSLKDGTLSLQGSSSPLQGDSIPPKTLSKLSILIRLLLGSGTLWLVARISSRCVNINRFSLHALYRNRLIRAYLGASRQSAPS